MFALIGFHFDKFNTDSQRGDVPHFCIGLEALRSRGDFHVDRVVCFKMLFGLEKRPAHGEVSNAAGPAAISRNRRA